MTDEKKAKYLKISIIVLIVILITATILWFIPSKEKEAILNIEAPELMFVGETNNLKITSNNDTYITIKQGLILSNKTYFEEYNPNVILSPIKSGQEEITITSKDLYKTISILVCKKIELANTNFEMAIGDSKKVDFNIDGDCLSQYNISIENPNIAEYQNGEIYAKDIGSTNLIITRLDEKFSYPINIIDNLSFDITKTEFNVGDKTTIPVINKKGSLICSSNNDLISIKANDDGCYIEALKEGTTIIKATVGNQSTEATITIVKPNIEVENITISKKAVRIVKGKTYIVIPQITPANATDKTITYTSNNPSIASVSNGVITALKYGTTTIEARTKNGKKATISIIVTGSSSIDSYESSSLNYWIDQRESTYSVTHIWVEDAYSQFKTAITSPKNTSSFTPRIPQNAKTIITNAINSKNYQNKGLIAVNASAMVSNDFGIKAPSSWYGTSQIPLIINDGIVIRNSTSEEIKTDSTYVTYGLNRNGYLTYYKFNNGNTSEQKNQNKALVSTIINDGVLNTFGFKPVLLENGQVLSNSNDPNIRQGLCQVDKNNFIIITNTSSNRDIGFTFKKLAEEFKNLNCQTAFNLDGGRSTCIYYKYNNNTLKNVSTPYEGRLLSDMIYFVEK